MKINTKSFMCCTLVSRIAVAVVAMMLTGVSASADTGEDVVYVEVAIPTYFHVDLVQPEIHIVSYEDPDDFGILYTGTSDINVITNTNSSLRTRESEILYHASGNEVPISASVQFLGNSQAHRRYIGGVWYRVLWYDPGIHLGTATLSVSVLQEWDHELPAGDYSGTVVVDLVDGHI